MLAAGGTLRRRARRLGRATGDVTRLARLHPAAGMFDAVGAAEAVPPPHPDGIQPLGAERISWPSVGLATVAVDSAA